MATPNMGLTIPTINVTTDPLWSQYLNADLQIIADHNHDGTTNGGVKLGVASLDIDGDLALNGFNLTDIRTLQMQSLSSDPALGADINCPYVKNGNLWFNNSSGAHVQITSGSGLNVSVGASNVFIPKVVTSNYTILNTDTFTYFEINTAAARNIFLPGANTVSAARYYFMKDTSGLSETNAITVVPNGTDNIDGVNASYVVKKNYGSWLFVSDGANNWYVSVFSNKDMNSGTFNSIGSNMLIDGKGNSITLRNDANGIFSIDGASGDGYMAGGNLTIRSNETFFITTSQFNFLGGPLFIDYAPFLNATTSVSREISLPAYVTDSGYSAQFPTDWAWTAGYWFNHTQNALILFEVDNLIDLATIDSIDFAIAGGSYSNLPTTTGRAQYSFYVVDGYGNTTQLVQTYDPSASLSAWNNAHIVNLDLSGIVDDCLVNQTPTNPSDKFDGKRRYRISVNSPDNNFQSNSMQLLWVNANYSVTKLTPG